jgi:SH3-like domain-containing protein
MKAPFVVMIIVIIMFGLIYLDVRHDISSMKSGIIIAHVSVGAKSAPNEGAKTLLQLPEGTKVDITGEQTEWREVESIDGSKGWVKSEDVRSLVW